MNGTVYSKDTGEIYVAMYGPDEESIKIQLPLYDNATYVLGAFIESDQWYLPGGVKTARPDMELKVLDTAVAVGDPVTIAGIPDGCRVIGQDIDVVVTDGVIEWDSNVKTTFNFEFILFPYKSQGVTIEVADL